MKLSTTVFALLISGGSAFAQPPPSILDGLPPIARNVTAALPPGLAKKLPIIGGGASVPGEVHQALAPLLAAGIPAFLALGGGAWLGRLRRRRYSEV